MVAGIRLKEAGFRRTAGRVIDAVLEADPDHMPAHYERGVLLRDLGRLPEAVASLYEARRCDPADFRANLLLIQMLQLVGDHKSAASAAARTVPANAEQTRQLEVAKQGGDFLAEFSRERARSLIAEVGTAYDWIGVHQVAHEIEQAIEARRGYALIRLGDGEGAFARVDADDEARFAALYAAYRREWTTFLLGEPLDPVATGYDALAGDLMSTACEADVLGVPYSTWIDHEYDIMSLRTIVCLLNVHRSLIASPPARRPRLCDQNVHMHLFTSGLLEPIIRRANRISVISCLQGLPDLLQRRFELDDVEFYAVPSECDAPHLGESRPAPGVHFPQAYEAMVARLSRPHDGRVFLVAAGTFGKFYAAVIKRHGGVALDIGSLVDAWMNLRSRIGYDETLAL